MNRNDDQKQFDYIIVGSGAGGGPLAARLAEGGCRVLVLEAGSDQTTDPPHAPAREVSQVPSFSAVATEHPDLAWEFFVDHYSQPPTGLDPKRVTDPDHPGYGKIFYPRAAAVGGCTVHNAMITIAGPDSDWDELAERLEDDSWRSEKMRGYFQKLERNEYIPKPDPIPRTRFGRIWDRVRWLVGFPVDHTGGQHGFRGWLRTSLTDVELGLHDFQLIKMLKGALRQSRRAGLDRTWTLLRRFFKGQIKEALDPNHARTMANSPEGIALVPLAICGPKTTIHQDSSTPWVQRGRRSSPREFLLEAQQAHPDRLTIWSDCLVTEVLFDETGDRPRAKGVKFLRGKKLYRAHIRPTTEPGVPDEVCAEREVILCGGAFNTPQLLMLSGIGEREHLKEMGIKCRVDLPGVGKKLQDRYEVTVISKMNHDFSLLSGATFELPDGGKVDPHLRMWRETGTGLYTSNGSVLSILKRSRPDLEKPDLFIFGIPLPFKGYELDYSNVGDIHDEFTWAILKSQTHNGDGQVKLRSKDPLDTPDINFHYFNECSRKDGGAGDPDLAAVVDGVKFVRGIADRASLAIEKEAHPGREAVPDDDEKIGEWIRQQAWGHHACGTCRMGPHDDDEAVLDSRFRVRSVDGLRVVDASVFPRIPGYFIVTNIYMVSEKAADVILADFHSKPAPNPLYPEKLRVAEAQAVETRRRVVAGVAETSSEGSSGSETESPEAAAKVAPDVDDREWADDVTGLGLSGGGIRAATLFTGVLQGFTRKKVISKFDFLSTVSGGGYIGSFLGRLFDRLRRRGSLAEDEPVEDRVEEVLGDPESSALSWLRRHGNYISPNGGGDARTNLATFLRNLLSVHFVVGVVALSGFGLANAVRYGIFDKIDGLTGFFISRDDFPIGHLISSAFGLFFSPWLILAELLLLIMVVPRMVAYWLASQEGPERFSAPALGLVLLFVGVLLFLGVHDGLSPEPVLIALSLLTSFVWVEAAWNRGRKQEAAVGSGGPATQKSRTRNFLTYDLGLGLAFTGGAFGFALIDTLAHGLQQWAADNENYSRAFAGLVAALAGPLPVLRFVVNFYAQDQHPKKQSALLRSLKKQATAAFMAVALLVLPLVFYSFASHAAFRGGDSVILGIAATFLALVVSGILSSPAAIAFVNRSSLAQTYAARLARAYLGATNPNRQRGEGANVTQVMPGDDVASIRDYRPHEGGGPLHLINVVVNQTVDFHSHRGNRDRKGENLAVSSLGMSVGKDSHSLWQDSRGADGRPKPVAGRARLEPALDEPGGHHPLVDLRGEPANLAETLSLRQWMSISGAAFGPGVGQRTRLGTALLFGLLNFRTGWWWDSNITDAGRRGFPNLSFLRRALHLIPEVLVTQCLLLSEWIARFPGPWSRYWYLSDGGYFENLAGYELIRRRVPRMVLCDGGADPDYKFDDFANLVRKARIDFEASIVSFEPDELEQYGIPERVRKFVGTLEDLEPERDDNRDVVGPSKKHAALCWVQYASDPKRRSVILYLKASLTGDESSDVKNYRVDHPTFPHESTADQFFDESQWESYRKLGEEISTPLFEDGCDWFWRIPLDVPDPTPLCSQEVADEVPAVSKKKKKSKTKSKKATEKPMPKDEAKEKPNEKDESSAGDDGTSSGKGGDETEND